MPNVSAERYSLTVNMQLLKPIRACITQAIRYTTLTLPSLVSGLFGHLNNLSYGQSYFFFLSNR